MGVNWGWCEQACACSGRCGIDSERVESGKTVADDNHLSRHMIVTMTRVTRLRETSITPAPINAHLN